MKPSPLPAIGKQAAETDTALVGRRMEAAKVTD